MTKEHEWQEKRIDEYFYDSSHSLTERQVNHIKTSLIIPLIFQAQLSLLDEMSKKIERMSQEEVLPGLKYGDTNYESNSVRYGINENINAILALINQKRSSIS